MTIATVRNLNVLGEFISQLESEARVNDAIAAVLLSQLVRLSKRNVELEANLAGVTAGLRSSTTYQLGRKDGINEMADKVEELLDRLDDQRCKR